MILYCLRVLFVIEFVITIGFAINIILIKGFGSTIMAMYASMGFLAMMVTLVLILMVHLVQRGF